MDMFDILQNNPLFGVAGEEELRDLAENRAIEISLEPGQELKYSKRSMGIIVSGALNIYKKGTEKVLVQKLKAGALFGAANVFGSTPDFVTKIDAAIKSEVILIEAEAVENLIRSSADFSCAYIRFLTDRIRFLNGKIADLTLSNAEKKVAAYFAKQGDFVSPNRSKLSQMLNIGRASLYRAIDSLEEAKLIAKEDDGYRIINKEELERMSGI